MAEIRIGEYCVTIDDEDEARVLTAGPWFLQRKHLPRLRFLNKEGTYLHRLIACPPFGERIRVYGTGLDLRKRKLGMNPGFMVLPSLPDDPKNTSRVRLAGLSFLVDAEDVDRIRNAGAWHLLRVPKALKLGLYYVNHTVTLANGERSTESLHRLLMGDVKGQITDHIDRNTLNCMKSNLRNVTASVSLYNTGIRSDNKSGFKGVCWHKAARKWAVSLRIKGHTIYGKLFVDFEEAKKARLALEQLHLPEVITGGHQRV